MKDIVIKKVSNLNLSRKNFDYIGPVYSSKRKDLFFTGKIEYKKWRVAVDKKGRVYQLEKR